MGVIYIGPDASASSDYGIVVETPPNRDFPSRKISRVSIPGRNGDYIIDSDAYENTVREYEIAFGTFYKEDFYSQANKIRTWLNNAAGPDEYYRLADTYEPDVYRMARFDEAGSFSNILNYAGRTTIRFNCKPQRFLVNGNVSYDYLTGMGGTMFNPYMPSKPYIIIKGTGDAVLTIGAIKVNINGLTSNEQIDIDCDTMQAFYKGASSIINKNGMIELVDGVFPVLASGENVITLAAQTGKSFTATEFKLNPRWWIL